MSVCMVINIDRCWGCKSCQVACKCEHGLAAGSEYWIEVARIEQLDTQGAVQCDFIPLMCMHCADAPCIKACPVHAIGRDGRGAVLIDQERCVGCGKCETHCPYGAVSVPQSKPKKALKCDLCLDRSQRGLPPSCMQHCLGHAFTLCEEKDLAALVKGYYHWSRGQIHYISAKLRDLGIAISN